MRRKKEEKAKPKERKTEAQKIAKMHVVFEGLEDVSALLDKATESKLNKWDTLRS